MKGLFTLLLLVLLAFSGCLDSTPDDSKSGGNSSVNCKPGTVDVDGVNLVKPSDDVIPIDRDNWDFEATNYRTCTLEKVNQFALRFNADGSPNPHKYLGEIDMRGDLNIGVVSVLGNTEDPMVYVLDITDRANPVVISVIDQFMTYITDVKISDDGAYLFTASQNLPTAASGEFPTQPLAVTTPVGFTVYDIRDRASPSFVMTIPNVDDIGCHMLSHEIIDGTDVVFCVGQQISAHGFLRNPVDGLVYLGPLQYFLPDGKGTLLPGNCVNDVILVGDPTGLLCNGPHDMTVAKDKVDGKTYMVASHWNEGVRVVDVSQPIDNGFVTVGSWDGAGAKHYDGNLHSAMMFWVGEHRYVVATAEMTYAGVVPALWVLNATSLDGELELIAEWYHPLEFETPGLLMTLHQWQVAATGPDVSPEDVRVYITWNHLGVWVLKWEEILAGDNLGAIGGFHMSRQPLDQATSVSNAILSTWDVNIVDGYIYGSDRATGLWIFHYTPDTLGDERLTGFA